MRLFKILNIEIKVSYTMILLLFISIFFNYFFQLIILMLIIILHELSHCAIAIYYGITTTEIKLFLFGGVAMLDENVEITPLKEAVIALAGPFSNLIMLVITLLLIKDFGGFNNQYISFFISANVAIGLFNLLPILPLDGGRIFRAVLRHYKGIKWATKVIIIFGVLVCSFLFVVGLYLAKTEDYQYIFFTLMSIFLLVCNIKEKRMIRFNVAQKLVLRKKSLFVEGIMDVKYLIALESVELIKIFQEFTLEKYYIVTVIDIKGRVLGTLSENEIIDGMIKHDGNVSLGFLFKILQKKLEE